MVAIAKTVPESEIACDDCRTSAGEQASSRRLTHSEELWVRAVRTGTGITVTALQLHGAVESHQIEAAIAQVAALHPILRARIVSKPRASHELYLHNCTSRQCVTVATAQWDDAGTDTEGVTALQRLAKREMNATAAETKSEDGSTSIDVFQVHVYQADLATAVVFRAHSAAIDRTACRTVTEAFIAAVTNQEASGRSPQTDPVAEGQQEGDVCALPRPLGACVPKSAPHKGFLSRAVDAVGYVAKGLTSSMLPFQAGCSDYRRMNFQSDFVSLKFDPAVTGRLLEACREHECSLFGLEISAALKAAAHMKQLGNKSESFGVTSIIDCRKYMEGEARLGQRSVGAYESALPLTQAAAESTPLWDLTTRLCGHLHGLLANHKHFTDLPVIENLFSKALAAPQLTKDGSYRTSFLTAFADAPFSAPTSSAPAGTAACCHVSETVGPVVGLHGIGPCIGMPDFLHQDGSLELLFVFATPLYAPATVHELANLTKAHLLEAASLTQ